MMTTGEGLYLFKFDSNESRDAVLEAGMWHVAHKPLILRKWQPGMQLLKFNLST